MATLFGGLLAVLLAAPFAASAADTPPTHTPTPTTVQPNTSPGTAPAAPAAASESAGAARTLKALDAQLRDLASSRAATEQCFALEASLKGDLARKKAQLSAEFKGRIPASFDDFLWQKNERINKQHKTCFLQYEALGRQLAAMDTAFATIEPKSLDVKRQRAEAEQEKQKYLRMVATAKPNNRPKAKTAE